VPKPPNAAKVAFHGLDPAFQKLYGHVEHGAAVDLPALRGTYEVWKAYIDDAVRDDAPPSRELILANEQLAAWEARLGIGRVSSFPITISVSLTEVCNARCSFCAYVPERVGTERIELAQIARADWLKFCKTFTPNGGGLGEPFAHPDVVEIFQAIRKMAPHIKISVISNGSLLRDDAIHAITGFVDCLKVSLSAATQETYERTMAPLKWERTMSNLRRLRDEKRRRNTTLPLMRAGYVLHTENVEELPQFPALIHEIGFSELYVNVMNPPLPVESRQLMTRAQSVFNVPDLARVRVAEMEAECARLGLRLIERLPTFGGDAPLALAETAASV
jgi:wyosine [tRNA(Phe)-imidazoG37] synthetase (radical SAM superfamily)